MLADYQRVRATTVELSRPLEPEDMVVQTMPDVSPTKWHLAHVTWFFEVMVLDKGCPGYRLYDERFLALFNSYYQALGTPHARPRRGLLSRPTVEEVCAYRRYVDEAMTAFFAAAPDETLEACMPLVTVGLQHEQQHQELLLMDIQHVFAHNPLRPAYRRDAAPKSEAESVTSHRWCTFDGGEVMVGFGAEGFAYDNERPRHVQFLEPFAVASRPVTAGEYREFMGDGGYQRPELWLADGWDLAQAEGWRAPLYWEEMDGIWQVMTLAGQRDVIPGEPVCHVSYFEADAFARWAGCRLPTEFEWEHAAQRRGAPGTFLESGALHPRPLESASPAPVLDQLYGDVWEWTSSPYAPYPGFRPFEGELGEYNGKFMVNQFVLRGGCCVTPEDHVRRTYRNFYYPHQRWMYSGIRLAR